MTTVGALTRSDANSPEFLFEDITAKAETNYILLSVADQYRTMRPVATEIRPNDIPSALRIVALEVNLRDMINIARPL